MKNYEIEIKKLYIKLYMSQMEKIDDCIDYISKHNGESCEEPILYLQQLHTALKQIAIEVVMGIPLEILSFFDLPKFFDKWGDKDKLLSIIKGK